MVLNRWLRVLHLEPQVSRRERRGEKGERERGERERGGERERERERESTYYWACLELLKLHPPP